MTRQRVFSAAPWESKVGYCRAIKAGDLIFVTGTAAVDDNGKTFEPGNAYAQAKRCLLLIERALKGLGADLSSVVRTRMFVTDIAVAGVRPGPRRSVSRLSAGDNDGRSQISHRAGHADRNRSRRGALAYGNLTRGRH